MTLLILMQMLNMQDTNYVYAYGMQPTEVLEPMV